MLSCTSWPNQTSRAWARFSRSSWNDIRRRRCLPLTGDPFHHSLSWSTNATRPRLKEWRPDKTTDQILKGMQTWWTAIERLGTARMSLPTLTCHTRKLFVARLTGSLGDWYQPISTHPQSWLLLIYPWATSCLPSSPEMYSWRTRTPTMRGRMLALSLASDHGCRGTVPKHEYSRDAAWLWGVPYVYAGRKLHSWDISN